ncbi:MAG: ABC transporter ATP-binding protein [Candidatus Bathyarchaeia archaeon]
MPIIEIENLKFRYAATKSFSLVDINLRIEEGEFIILTGPSGCGKTTLCRCLNGLIPNFYSGELKGSIYVAGLNVPKTQTSELSKYVGFVFQNPENQLFSLSVERDVAFGPENLGLSREEIKKRVEWALEVTGTSSLREYAPYELSGGQQQKVAIACVLAMRPKIIILDEPTSFLDPKSALEILKVINKLNKELKITIILVEHRLDMASQFADRVIVMNQGRIELDGAPSEVYNKYAYLLGIGIPKVSLLFILFKEDGLEFKKVPINVSECEKEVRRYVSE